MRVLGNKGFWAAGYALWVLMTGTNLPAPLYGIYEHRWGFQPGVLTLIYSTYVLLLLPSLLFFGPLSDHFGRKKVILMGLVLAVVGAAVFGEATSVAALFVARAIQGIAAGAVTAGGTAALVELYAGRDQRFAAMIASSAPTAGTGMGALMAGILAQYGPFPLELPYGVEIFMLLVGIAGVLAMRETVPQTSVRWKIRRPAVPAEIRAVFAVGSATTFTAWAVGALFTSLVPVYVASQLRAHNLAVTGGVVFLMMGASATVQVLGRRGAFRTTMGLGLILMVLGLVGMVLAVPMQSLGLLLASTVVIGVGQGLAFMGGTATVNSVAPAWCRGEVLSGYYMIAYAGTGCPIIGVGFGAQAIGLYNAVLVFTVLIGLLGLLLALRIGRSGALLDTKARSLPS